MLCFLSKLSSNIIKECIVTDFQNKILKTLELITDVFVSYGIDFIGVIIILSVGWMGENGRSKGFNKNW